MIAAGEEYVDVVGDSDLSTRVVMLVTTGLYVITDYITD